MRPAARAVVLTSSDSPQQISAQTVLRQFLDTAVDSLIRTSTAGWKSSPADSIHDRWVRALTAAEGTIAASKEELTTLAAQTRQWHRPIQAPSNGHFRL